MNEKNKVLPYETSMKLKKLGYNEFCCSAPYIEDVVNWLEEKHGISVYVKPDIVNGWDEELNSFATYSRGWKVVWIKKAETGTISTGYLDGYFTTRAEALKSGVEKIIDGLS